MPKTELEKREILRLSNEASHKLTQECIHTALLYLMKQKSFEKITITELIKRSGVSRSAFYRNYSSKEDVIKEMSEHLFNDFRNSLLEGHNTDNLYQWFYNIFTKIKENESIFRLFIQADIAQLLPEEISTLEKIFPPHSVEEHYQILALEGAFGKVLYGWFLGGMEESIEYMADFCSNKLYSRLTNVKILPPTS